MERSPLLELKDIKKYFPGTKGRTVKAVDGITLSIERGEIVGLVGESGCGKSTLGRAALKLHDISSGQILFDGEDITGFTDSQMRPLRKRMQIIFQDPYASLNPRKKIGQIVGMPLEIQSSCSGKERRERVAEILREVGLGEAYMGKFPHEMSGGQRQRVVIARALINNPELVVCDEPVSALDVSVRAQVLNLLKDLQRDRRLAYIFISHDLSVVEYLCDRIAVMYLGRIMEFADKKSLFSRPLHPYTRALFSAIPVPDIHVRKEEIILEGEVPSPVNPPKGCLFSTRCPYAEERCRREAPVLEETEDCGVKRSVACFRYKEIMQDRKRQIQSPLVRR